MQMQSTDIQKSAEFDTKIESFELYLTMISIVSMESNKLTQETVHEKCYTIPLTQNQTLEQFISKNLEKELKKQQSEQFKAENLVVYADSCQLLDAANKTIREIKKPILIIHDNSPLTVERLVKLQTSESFTIINKHISSNLKQQQVQKAKQQVEKEQQQIEMEQQEKEIYKQDFQNQAAILQYRFDQQSTEYCDQDTFIQSFGGNEKDIKLSKSSMSIFREIFNIKMISIESFISISKEEFEALFEVFSQQFYQNLSINLFSTEHDHNYAVRNILSFVLYILNLHDKKSFFKITQEFYLSDQQIVKECKQFFDAKQKKQKPQQIAKQKKLKKSRKKQQSIRKEKKQIAQELLNKVKETDEIITSIDRKCGTNSIFQINLKSKRIQKVKNSKTLLQKLMIQLEQPNITRRNISKKTSLRVDILIQKNSIIDGAVFKSNDSMIVCEGKCPTFVPPLSEGDLNDAIRQASGQMVSLSNKTKQKKVFSIITNLYSWVFGQLINKLNDDQYEISPDDKILELQLSRCIEFNREKKEDLQMLVKKLIWFVNYSNENQN